jgi:hypothetical protein
MLTADDRIDILEVIAVASQALDRADGDGFAAAFTADATMTTGVEQEWGTAQLANLAARQSQNTGLMRRHTSTTVLGELDEGLARAVSYVLVTRVVPGPRVLVVATGVYDDEVTRTEAGWRISKRVAVADGQWNLMI